MKGLKTTREIVVLTEYEMTVIAKADIPESEILNTLAKYEKYMTADGGQILRKDVWGTKKLCFPISKQYRGHYVNYDFVGAATNLSEMERLMRIDDNVLRYLSIKLGKNIDVDARRAEIAKEAAAAAAAAARRDFDDDRGGDMVERGDKGDRDFRDRE